MTWLPLRNIGVTNVHGYVPFVVTLPVHSSLLTYHCN